MHVSARNTDLLLVKASAIIIIINYIFCPGDPLRGSTNKIDRYLRETLLGFQDQRSIGDRCQQCAAIEFSQGHAIAIDLIIVK